MDLNELFKGMPSSLKDLTVEPPKRKVDENLYVTDPKEGKDNVYKAKIRFLLNINNKSESIVSIFYHWLTDANKENGVFVIDPSTVGDKSPIGDVYFKFSKSENPVEKGYAEMLSRKRRYYSLIQIVQDEQHPELEGKIKILAYGQKIKAKLEEEEADEDGGNPFNLLSSRLFKMEVKMAGGFINYDSCRFSGSKVPLSINGTPITEDKDASRLLKYYESAPSLDEYKYKPWSAETIEKVNANLKTYLNGFTPTAIENALRQEPDNKVSTPINVSVHDDDEPTNSYKEPVEEVVDDDDDFLAGINI